MLNRIPRIVWFLAFALILDFYFVEIWNISQRPPKAPGVNLQQQAKNSLDSERNAAPSPAALENGGSNQNNHGREIAPEVTFLRIRLGEWLIGGVTLLLWGSTQLLVRENKRSSERQLRAYMAVRPQTVHNLYPERIPSVDFIIENTGQTPAYNVRYAAFVDVLEYPLVAETEDLVIPARGPIPTQAIHSRSKHIGDTAGDTPITFDEWAQITNGNRRFYLIGVLYYQDIFKRERKTRFCAYLGGPELQQTATLAFKKGGPIVIVPTFWTFAEVHNEAT